MTKFDPEYTFDPQDDYPIPQWVIDEHRDRAAEEAEQDHAEYQAWADSWHEDDERPTFTNGYRYNDGGAMLTIAPRWHRRTIDQHVDNTL